MPHISKTKILPFSHKELFDLVMDVESYVDFLPFCTAAKITSSKENQMEADLTLSFGSFSDSYSSLIIPKFSDDYAMIEVKGIRGAFKYLSNHWKFTPIDASSTRVEFVLDFEVTSLLLSKIIDVSLSRIYDKILDAFENRAREKYGTKNSSN